MSEVKNYYADDKKQTFYQKYWGGESIHVGIYLNEFKVFADTDSSDDDYELGSFIRDASRFKSNVMSNLIKSYLLTERFTHDSHGNKVKFTIADWGAGYGGTARTLSKMWNGALNLSLSCYDLSDRNCEYNAKINAVEEHSNIAIYNQSFLDIENRWFDIIYSEDAFVHLDDKQLIFDRAYENLNTNGHFIFSDIILKNPDTCSEETLKEICRRINVNTVGSRDGYIKCAETAGLTLCNVIEYNADIKKHYKYIKQFYQENEPPETQDSDILTGLDDWIRHADEDNLTMAIFIFKKDKHIQ